MSGVDPNYPSPTPPGAFSLEQRPGNGIAIAALVLGIVSLALFCIWYVALPCAILAIVFGNIGRKRARAGAPGGNMATGGLICGVIALGIAVLMIGLFCAGISLLGTAGFEEFQKAMEEATRQLEQGTPTSGPVP